VRNRKGKTLVTNAGSNGKFLAVLDLEVKGGKLGGLPLPAAAGVRQLLAARSGDDEADRGQRAPFAAKLSEELARTDAS